MTDPTTPTTEAGRALWDVEVTLRAFIVRIEAEAAAQARADERRRLAGLVEAGTVMKCTCHAGTPRDLNAQEMLALLSDTEPAP